MGSFALASSLGSSSSMSPSEEAARALTSAQRALGFFVQASLDSSITLDSSSSVPPPVADPQNTTDEVNFDQMETDEVTDYSLVVIMPLKRAATLFTVTPRAGSVNSDSK